MAERDDPGIAENEVEREREQGEPGDLGEDEVPAGQQEHARQRRQPENVFERTPAGADRQVAGNLLDQGGGHRRARRYLPAARANRPCGRRISTTIMIV